MLLAVLAVILSADPLTPEQAARIQVDQANAQAEVSKRFGDKKISELSSDERRELVRAQRDAEKQVLEKAGVDAKAWARYQSKLSREEYQSVKNTAKTLQDAKTAAKPEAAPELQIQHADDEVNAEETTTESGVVIEHGVEGQVELEGQEAAADEKPAPKPKAKKRHR